MNYNELYEKKTKNRLEALKILSKIYLEKGYKYIRVWYEGCGDSGECFHAEGWKGKIDLETKDENGYYPNTYESIAWNHNREENFDEWKNMTRNQREVHKIFKEFSRNYQDLLTSNDDLQYVLADMIDYDWYNNEGGQGEVIWDLNKGTIKIEGQQNVQSYNEITTTYNMSGNKIEQTFNSELQER